MLFLLLMYTTILKITILYNFYQLILYNYICFRKNQLKFEIKVKSYKTFLIKTKRIVLFKAIKQSYIQTSSTNKLKIIILLQILVGLTI